MRQRTENDALIVIFALALGAILLWTGYRPFAELATQIASQ